MLSCLKGRGPGKRTNLDTKLGPVSMVILSHEQARSQRFVMGGDDIDPCPGGAVPFDEKMKYTDV